MRLIHTSDWHLGQKFYGKSRAKEHQYFLTWLLTQVKQQQIDAVIVAGDIFDTTAPPSYAREMYFDFIAKIHQLNCQLIVIAGNHDSVAMLIESKPVLNHLSTHVIALAREKSEQQVITLTDSQGMASAIICAIPFIRPRDVLLSRAGQSANQKQADLQQAISDYYQKIVTCAQKKRQQLNVTIPIIATGHLTTVGASCSESVRDIYIGSLSAFPASAFPEVDYIALGHIHRGQKVAKKDHIRYSGSPIALSFDEAERAKQVLRVDFKQGKLCQVSPLTVPCLQPLAMLKTTLTDLVTDVQKLIAKFSTQLSRENIKIWLDVEIINNDYLTDLQQRIESLVDGYPVEILRVRRARSQQKQASMVIENTTLNEISEIEVFEKRLALETWETDEEKQQKKRVETLYKQIVNDTKAELKV